MKNQLLLFLLLYSTALLAQRQEISFNKDWQFEGTSPSGVAYQKSISIPHTWNDKDAQAGITQHRTIGVYTKTFFGNTDWSQKRVFIHFEGSNIATKVSLNGQKVGEHKGGYAAFSFELSPYLLSGKDNVLKVEVSNELDMAAISIITEIFIDPCD